MAFVSTNKAPGVYIDEIQIPGPITGAPTSTTAFVGPAQMGPLLKPTMLTSAQQFAQIFGTYIEDPFRVYVTHAVNGFFNEGGGVCYFVRVGTGVQATLTLHDRRRRPPADPGGNCPAGRDHGQRYYRCRWPTPASRRPLPRASR